jgi:hypothetical protein
MPSFFVQKGLKKAVLFFLFLVLIVPAWCQAAAAPNSNDYPITIHVTSSQLDVKPGNFQGNYTVQKLRVVINGKKYKLEDMETGRRLLALGDYKARLAEDEHKSTYESFQVYELLFPDQTTRKFRVVGQSE